MSTQERKQLWLVLGAAALLRVLWIALCPNEPISDQVVYHRGAVSIAAGHGFVLEPGEPIGFWPVGYSAVLAAGYAVFGSHYAVAYVFNLLCGLVLVVAVYFLGRQLYGERVARYAAWAAAVYPTFVLYTTIIASENLYNPLLVACVAVFVRASRGHNRAVWVVLAGVLLGLTATVRPTALAMPTVFLCSALVFGAGLWRAGLWTAVVFALTVAIMVPWGLRNQEVFGKFSLTSFNGGAILWMGNHEGSDGTMPTAEEAAKFGDHLPTRDEAMRDEAVAFIKSNPLRFIELSLLRVFSTLRAETIAAGWNEIGIAKRFGGRAVLAFKLLATLGYYLVFAAALLDVVLRARARRLGRGDVVIAVVVLLSSVPFVLMLGMDRYHLPLIPFFFLLGASAVASFVARRGGGEAPSHA